MHIMDAVIWFEQRSVALVFLVFSLMLVATYWPGRKKSIERNGSIPLEDDR